MSPVLLPALIAAIPLTAGPESRLVTTEDNHRGAPPQAAESPATYQGAWRLSWDDSVNNELEPVGKSCEIVFETAGQEVIGRFVGPVAGRERQAVIKGRLHGDAGQLFVFQQHEPGYVCTYQVHVDPRHGRRVGAWVDSQGRSGDFMLLKHQ